MKESEKANNMGKCETPFELASFDVQKLSEGATNRFDFEDEQINASSSLLGFGQPVYSSSVQFSDPSNFLSSSINADGCDILLLNQLSNIYADNVNVNHMNQQNGVHLDKLLFYGSSNSSGTNEHNQLLEKENFSFQTNNNPVHNIQQAELNILKELVEGIFRNLLNGPDFMCQINFYNLEKQITRFTAAQYYYFLYFYCGYAENLSVDPFLLFKCRSTDDARPSFLDKSYQPFYDVIFGIHTHLKLIFGKFSVYNSMFSSCASFDAAKNYSNNVRLNNPFIKSTKKSSSSNSLNSLNLSSEVEVEIINPNKTDIEPLEKPKRTIVGSKKNSLNESCPEVVVGTKTTSNKGERKFLCTFRNCYKRFFRSDDLNRHIRIHTGDRPFCCGFCQRRFSRSDHLKTHQRIHTGIKPFKCDYCEKSFKRSDEKKRHMRSHMKENSNFEILDELNNYCKSSSSINEILGKRQPFFDLTDRSNTKKDE